MSFLTCLIFALVVTIYTFAQDYPVPHHGNIQVHDPTIIQVNETYYLFKGSPSIEYFKAQDLSGPWSQVGTVLNGPSIIAGKASTQRPWAPTIVQNNGSFYCLYAVTKEGTRNSSIGIATSATMQPGSWTDHGALINTGSGPLSDISPYTQSNAIDPSAMVDPADGKPWLTFGSYWTDIWQVPLTADMLSVENPAAPDAHHLAFLESPDMSNQTLNVYPVDYDPQGSRPEEGSWISYREPYYYLWFARGQCCNFNSSDLPPAGTEYVY
jgi:arabinan endo-1,5-alpha-L-arabinosidase